MKYFQNDDMPVFFCDGNCEKHKGEVMPIIIIGGLFDGVKFNYCQEAIKEDERRGFIIKYCR